MSPDYMVLYFIHGYGHIIIEGKYYDIHAGDVFLVNPTELFHCTIQQGKYHERIVLHIETKFTKSLPYDTSILFSVLDKREKGSKNCIPAKIVSNHAIDKQLLEILNLLQNPQPLYDILAVCKVTELLVQLNQLPPFAEPKTNATITDSSLPEKVLAYLNIHFSENISVVSVAKEFSIHESYLLHVFKEHTGMSLWNYVILRRLHAFNDLLRQGHEIEASCYRVGFQNYSNFFRLYKKYICMTPIQFKRKLQSDTPSGN